VKFWADRVADIGLLALGIGLPVGVAGYFTVSDDQDADAAEVRRADPGPADPAPAEPRPAERRPADRAGRSRARRSGARRSQLAPPRPHLPCSNLLDVRTCSPR
jgi:hypothetical protein